MKEINSMNKNKKILSFILTLAMVISIMSMFEAETYAGEPPNYLTFTALENSSVTLGCSSGSGFQYRKNNGEWENYTTGTPVTLNKGECVSFKGNNVGTGQSSGHFSMSGKIAASGDVTSLTNGTGGDVALAESCYNCMFLGCTALTSAPVLPATTLAIKCYANMFDGCTALEAAPALPAETMAEYCYISMFKGCTALTIAPALPATTLAENCYNSMFSGCIALTSAPALPATTLAAYCYSSMFSGCTALTSAPALPATTLAKACCYYMFLNCTALTSAPALPATNLAEYCYSNMFKGCTALTAPVMMDNVSSLATGCCQEMYSSCTALKIYTSSQSDSGYTKAWKATNTTTIADNWAKDMFKDCGIDSLSVTAGNTYYIKSDLTIGVQTSSLTYGTAGATTFNVTKIPTGPAFTNGTILWQTAGGIFTEATPTNISVSLGAFSEGAATLTVTASATAAAGTYKFKVAGQNGDANVTSDAVTLTIAPKDISVCTATDLSAQTYTYNGQQIAPEITVTDGVKELATNTDFKLDYGENKKAGTEAGIVTIAGMGNYTGTAIKKFDINKVEITLESASDSKPYDGTPLTNTVIVSNGGFADGEGATYDVTGTITKAGFVENVFTYTLNDGTNANNYNITTSNGTLTVTKAATPIVIIAASTSRQYDGTALQDNSYTSSGSLISGDTLTVVIEGIITNAGVTANIVTSVAIINNDGDNVTDCYKIITVPGILTVTKVTTPIAITAASVSKQYDGKALTANSYTSSGILMAGDTLTVVIEGIITDAGVAANNVTRVAITNSDGYDVTGCYDIITVAGILTVIPVYDDPAYNIPVSGEKGSINISATVSGNNATVNNITEKQLEETGTEGNVVMDLTTLSKSVTGVTIPKTTFENVAESNSEGLEIRMPNGTVAVFDKEVLSAVAAQAKGRNIQLVINKDSMAENTMSKAQKEAVKEMNNPVVLDAYFTSNGSRISDFSGGEAELTAAYPTEFPVRVWFVADDGEKTPVPCTYDGKTAKFTVGHFSHYVIEQLDGSSYKTCAKDENCVLAKYTDVVTDTWYHDGVHYCTEMGYMDGYGNDLFGPEDTLSRAMIVQILYNMENKPAVAEKSTFTDVDKDSWYADAIAWAENYGIVDGCGDGLFKPEDDITREQLALIMMGYAKYKGYDVTATAELTEFTDADLTSDWALEALKWAKAVELVSGKGNGILDPTGNATRAEAATMIMTFCEKIAK